MAKMVKKIDQNCNQHTASTPLPNSSQFREQQILGLNLPIKFEWKKLEKVNVKISTSIYSNVPLY